ncbi:hypothetical protein BH10PSE17_BH10PSE17_07230 [soil metagenome]
MVTNGTGPRGRTACRAAVLRGRARQPTGQRGGRVGTRLAVGRLEARWHTEQGFRRHRVTATPSVDTSSRAPRRGPEINSQRKSGSRLNFSKAKWGVIITMAVLSFVSGVATQWFWPGQVNSPVDVAFAIASSIAAFAWYRLDSDQRAYPRSFWLNVAVIGLTLIALPYYFFRSRGAGGGLKATLSTIALLVASIVLSIGGQYAYYFTQV